MGCKQSKAIRVQPVGPANFKVDNTDSDVEIKDYGTQTRGNYNGAFEYDVDSSGNKVKRQNKLEKKKSKKRRDSIDSCDSLNDDGSAEGDRGVSATSKKSQQSTDSGLGEDNANVITEFSPQNEVRRIEEEFGEEKEIELGITGKACPVRLSAKERRNHEESQVIAALREEGLINTRKSESKGGVSFEITSMDVSDTMRPPPRLAKLEKRKQAKVLTEDEIKRKLERAEKRRKRKEEEKLDKIKAINKGDGLAALESFVQHQKDKEDKVQKKLDEAVDKREQRLKEIREKMKAKELHAEAVRNRKLLTIDVGEEKATDEDLL